MPERLPSRAASAARSWRCCGRRQRHQNRRRPQRCLLATRCCSRRRCCCCRRRRVRSGSLCCGCPQHLACLKRLLRWTLQRRRGTGRSQAVSSCTELPHRCCSRCAGCRWRLGGRSHRAASGRAAVWHPAGSLAWAAREAGAVGGRTLARAERRPRDGMGCAQGKRAAAATGWSGMPRRYLVSQLQLKA